MLTYNLSQTNLTTDIQDIKIIGHKAYDIMNNDSQYLVVFEYEKTPYINQNSKIILRYALIDSGPSDSRGATHTYSGVEVIQPQTINKSTCTFSVYMDKYQDLSLSEITQSDYLAPYYWHLIKNGKTYKKELVNSKPDNIDAISNEWFYYASESGKKFNNVDEKGVIHLTTKPNGLELTENEYYFQPIVKQVFLRFDDDHSFVAEGLEATLYTSLVINGTFEELTLGAEYLNSTQLWYCIPYNNSDYKYNQPDTRTDEEVKEIIANRKKFVEWVFDDDGELKTEAFDIIVRKTNYILDPFTDITASVEVNTLSLPLVLESNNSLSANQEYNIQDGFVEFGKANSINGIIDMEKDRYKPMIHQTAEDGTDIYTDVQEIEFNFHFRSRGEIYGNWKTNPDDFWFGVVPYETDDATEDSDDDSDDDIVNTEGDVDEILIWQDDFYNDEFKNSISPCIKGDDNNYYFDPSDHSDLLYYLGFKISDIQYQKSSLKRSFLRLLFYDSMNPGNQNLLYTSSIFFDTNKLYSDYIRYNSMGLNMRNSIMVDGIPIRLSSQIKVSDTYTSNRSSEGFYLYLWKEGIDNIPSTIYMKVEFNHAKFGRIIPFMMPFFKTDENNSKHYIKTFEHIKDDWDTNTESDTSEGPYDIRRYMNYSYIRLKHAYDATNNQHVYYVDDSFYDNISQGDGKITFNLYEAKIV